MMGIKSKTAVILVLVVVFTVLLITPKEFITQPRIIGAVVSTVFVGGQKINFTCEYDLVQGFNLIGVPCKKDNSSVENVFAPLLGATESIHTYDGGDVIDPWKVYNPSLPSWAVNDLSTVDEKKGFWINLNAGQSTSINGTIEQPKVTGLSAGWRLVSYVSNESRNVTEALSSLSGSFSIVFGFNVSAGQFTVYDPALMNNTLENLSPSRGYWINVTQDDLWLIE